MGLWVYGFKGLGFRGLGETFICQAFRREVQALLG